MKIREARVESQYSKYYLLASTHAPRLMSQNSAHAEGF